MGDSLDKILKGDLYTIEVEYCKKYPNEINLWQDRNKRELEDLVTIDRKLAVKVVNVLNEFLNKEETQ